MSQYTDDQALLAELGDPPTDAERIKSLEDRLKALEDTVFSRRRQRPMPTLGQPQFGCIDQLGCTLRGIGVCVREGCPNKLVINPRRDYWPNQMDWRAQ